jgi:hypothetical protein
MEKIKRKKSNVFTEILPFYLTLKFAGIFPLSFNEDNGGNLRTTTSDKLLSVVVAISMVSIALTFYLRITGLQIGKVVIEAWGWYTW